VRGNSHRRCAWFGSGGLHAGAGVGRLGFRVRAWGNVMRVLLAGLLVGIAGCGGEETSPGDVAVPPSPTISPVKAENAEAGASKTKPGSDGSLYLPGRMFRNKRFFIRQLKSGALLMVRNNSPDGKRSHMTAFVSDDDGATWKGGLLLDERESSYPDGIPTVFRRKTARCSSSTTTSVTHSTAPASGELAPYKLPCLAKKTFARASQSRTKCDFTRS